MIEKALAAALEPVLDDLIALEKKLDAIQLREGPQGPQGEPAPPVNVTELAVKIYTEYGDKLKADPIDTDALLKQFITDHRAELKGETGEAGPQGEAGKDAEVDYTQLAERVYKDYGDSLRAPEPEPVDYTRLAELVVTEYGDQLKGVDAKQLDAVDIGLYLMEHHVDMLKGPKGQDAPAVDLKELAQEVVSTHGEQLKGKDAEPEIVAETVLLSKEFDLKLSLKALQLLEAQNELAIKEIDSVFE